MSGITIDAMSMLARIGGELVLGNAEEVLARDDWTLDLAPNTPKGLTVAAWLAKGAPGARSGWLDPADHIVAGFEATSASGEAIELRPVPRRAAGPDILALLWGTENRCGLITSAWLRIHPKGVARPQMPDLPGSAPAVSPLEAELWARIEAVLRTPPR